MQQTLSSIAQNAVTVLVVEDDELQRMSLADTMEEQGFTVLEATNGIEALKQIEKHPEVRLVFTDIQLTGEIDGLDLLRVVNMRWPHISLLTASGRVRPHYAELPTHARFIQKPLQEREIMKQMNELLAEVTYPSIW